MLCESQTACRHRYRGDDRRRLENKKPRSDARFFSNVPLRLLIKLSLLAGPRLLVAVVKTPTHLTEAGRIVAQGLIRVKKKRIRLPSLSPRLKFPPDAASLHACQ